MSTSERDMGSIVKIGLLVVLVAAIPVVLYFSLRNPNPVGGAYFYDLNTKKLFVASATAFAPIDAPSGPHDGEPAGVRIYIYSCSPCRGLSGLTIEQVKAKGAFPVWLEKYSPESKKLIEGGDNRPEVMSEGLLMRTIEGDKWISPASREAMALRESVNSLCPDGKAAICKP